MPTANHSPAMRSPKVEATHEAGSQLPALDAELGNRISELIEEVGGIPAAVEIAGKSADSLKRYADLRSGAPLAPIARLAQTAGYSLDWVVTGKGPKELARRQHLQVSEASAPYHALPGYVALPRFDVRAAAGVGLPVISEEIVELVYFQVDWLRRTLGVNPTQLGLIEAVGRSMAPTIEDGDLMIVDLSNPRLRNDGIYVLAHGDELMVKRVRAALPGRFVISSDNPEHSDLTREVTQADADAFRIVGRVVWSGGRI